MPPCVKMPPMSTLHDIAEGRGWSEWFPLARAVPASLLPEVPGLYRTRESGSDEVLYVGQTGRGLRSRLGALRQGVSSAHMPFRDPHAAAPALWALLDSNPGVALEASVVPGPDDTPTRRGWEDLCLGRYRQTHKRSPAFNFARMPPGYAASS